MPPGRPTLTLAAAAALLAVAVAWRLLAGSDGFGWPGDPIIQNIRLQRVATGAAVGGALALAGVLLQSLLRNPLAAPDLLGVSAGAGLGVSLQAWGVYAATGIAPATASPVAALVGALGALGVLAVLGRRRGGLDPLSLILSGVVIAVVCGAATTLVRAMMPDDPGGSTSRWLFGSLREDLGWAPIAGVGGVTLAGACLATLLGRQMDAASLDEEEARAVGVRLGRLRLFQFLASGALAAGAVTLAGPIGFVGLVCPHAVRLAAGPSHRVLVVGSLLAGAALVIGADASVRTWAAESGRLPIGVLTSLIGGPAFLLLLRKSR